MNLDSVPEESTLYYYRSLPQGKKKVIALRKDELDRKIMTKFVRLRTKTYSYLIDKAVKIKKQKAKKVCHKKKT